MRPCVLAFGNWFKVEPEEQVVPVPPFAAAKVAVTRALVAL